jgi:hypothetical protein
MGLINLKMKYRVRDNDDSYPQLLLLTVLRELCVAVGCVAAATLPAPKITAAAASESERSPRLELGSTATISSR